MKNEKIKRRKCEWMFYCWEKSCLDYHPAQTAHWNGMPEQETRAGLSLMTKTFIGLGIIVVAAPILYVVAVMIALKVHLKEDCRTLNMRDIGLRCRVHAANHKGQFPAKWSELKWDDMGGITNTTWDRAFVCPTVGHDPGNWKQVDLWSDYRLIPGRTTNDPPATVLAIEPLSNHKTGANVLFVDGSSQWWPAAKVIGQTPTPQRMPE